MNSLVSAYCERVRVSVMTALLSFVLLELLNSAFSGSDLGQG